MYISFDLDEMAQQLDHSKEQRLPPDRTRALNELNAVLTSDLSIRRFVAFCTVLAERHNFVRDNLDGITVAEALGSQAATPRQPGAKA